VQPTNAGYGTLMLKHVLSCENLEPHKMTVHPTSDGARRFFRRWGFNLYH